MSQPPPSPPPPGAPHTKLHAQSIFAASKGINAHSPPVTRGPLHPTPAPPPPPLQQRSIGEMNDKAEATVAKAGSDLRADEVVAAGTRPQELQLPSPVYGATWVDERHVFVAAGGGGRRFGMSNFVVLLDVHTSSAQASHDHTRPDAVESGGPRNASELPLWRFVSALDLDADVPWCTSRFLPYDPSSAQTSAAQQLGGGDTGDATYWSAEQQRMLCGLRGFVAVSSITCFYLIGVFTTEETVKGAYSLRRLARVVVPGDERNPDKKSIALVHHAVLVAHDECGVLLYDLATLLATHGAEDGLATRTVCPALAEWRLPARVNDLHANRIHLVRTKLARPSAKGSHDTAHSSLSSTATWSASVPRTAADAPVRADSVCNNCGSVADATQETHTSTSGSATSSRAVRCVALVLDYVLVAAALQDKTLRLGIFRLARHHKPRCVAEASMAEHPVTSSSTADRPVRALHRITEVAVLTGAACGLGFPLMPSSLRLVRLFALEEMTAAAEAASRKHLTLRSLKRQQQMQCMNDRASCAVVPDSAIDEVDELVSRMLLVAYDTEHGESYIVQADITAQLATTPRKATDAATRKGEGGDDVNGKWYDVPRLSVRLENAEPSPVVKDCITCVSPCMYDKDTRDGLGRAEMSSAVVEPRLPALPHALLAGTVEGWVVLLARLADSHGKRKGESSGYVLQAVRPSPHRRSVTHTPALHKEPVSALAVSARNDVVTGDIAQHIVLTTLAAPRQGTADVTALELFPTLHPLGYKTSKLSGWLPNIMLRGLLVAFIAVLLLVYLRPRHAHHDVVLQPVAGT